MVELEKVAQRVRRKILDMVYNAKDSHIGCSMSIVEILVSLYFQVMKIKPSQPRWPERDRFVLSKGHTAAALYAVLSERGFFLDDNLSKFAKDGSPVASHVAHNVLPGVETSGGSGGHGLSLGTGIALAARMDNLNHHIFVLSGDGELQEGSVWEAAMFASSRQLANLTLIVDRNLYQTWNKVDDVVSLEPLGDKLTAFGWNVSYADGHNMKDLSQVLAKIRDNCPHAVIANTIKGKGISFMEGLGDWHNGILTKEQYEIALKEVS